MADRIVGGRLAQILWDATAAGKSSRTIADELGACGIDVSYRTVQNWLARLAHPSTRESVS